MSAKINSSKASILYPHTDKSSCLPPAEFVLNLAGKGIRKPGAESVFYLPGSSAGCRSGAHTGALLRQS